MCKLWNWIKSLFANTEVKPIKMDVFSPSSYQSDVFTIDEYESAI